MDGHPFIQPFHPPAGGPSGGATLWNALMQIASQDLPREGWSIPAEVSVINVCDPSGMLPTAECPTLVSEVF